MPTPTPAPEATTSRGRRWAALAVLTASLLVITMDMTILNIALPDMAGELHPTSDQQLWIVDVYSLVLAGLLVPVAALADRWGRRRMLLAGYAVFALASLLVLVAHTSPAVIAVRALLGVGGAMIMPTTLSLIRVVFTDAKERATALSIWAAVSGLGAVAGPLVGGYLLEHFSWQSAFLVNVPPMVLAIVAGALILPESRVPNPGRLDVPAAVASLVGMVALVWALKQFGKEASLPVPSAWLATVLGVAALVWFIRRCLHSDSPLLDLGLFRNRALSAGVVAALASMFSMISILLLVAQWFQGVDGRSPVQAGVALIPLAVAGAIASLVAPPLARRIGARWVLAVGLGIGGLGLLYLGVIGEGLDATAVIVSMCLVGAGTGALAIGSALIMGGAAAHQAGSAGALEETAYELGGTLGVTILGSISSIVYRSELTGSPAFAALHQANATLADEAQESLGAAVAIASEAHLPAVAERAAAAFTASLQTTGLIGAVLMLLAAVAVFVLTPKNTDVNASH